jgi:hypothetical protein
MAQPAGSYTLAADQELIGILAQWPVKGQRGLVVGSERPWCEVIALNAGATHVTTSEYSKIITTHPQLTAIRPLELATQYFTTDFRPFDFAIIYSSVEHSGLGRYGDDLNPFGDFEAIAQVWCVLRPGARLFLAVPMSRRPDGETQFNAHRVYGWQRLSEMTANFQVLGPTQLPEDPSAGQPGAYGDQHVFILERVDAL